MSIKTRRANPRKLYEREKIQYRLHRVTKAAEMIKKLDAYGHMTYGVGFGYEGSPDGDWQAYADFEIDSFAGEMLIAYHVVVNSESGGFLETGEAKVVTADEAPYGLLDYWSNIGREIFINASYANDDGDDGNNFAQNRAASQKFDIDLKKAIDRFRRDNLF